MSQHVVPLFLSLSLLWQNGSYHRDAYLLRLCQLIWCISMLHSHLVYPAHLSHTCLTNNLGRFFDKFSAFSHVRNKHENICTNMQIVTNKKWWEWGEKKEEGEERKRGESGSAVWEIPIEMAAGRQRRHVARSDSHLCLFLSFFPFSVRLFLPLKLLQVLGLINVHLTSYRVGH